MLNLIKKLYNDSRIRYLFFGGLTTLVNLGMFALLKGPCGIDYKISNFFSVAIAICFAFVVNKLYVFPVSYTHLATLSVSSTVQSPTFTPPSLNALMSESEILSQFASNSILRFVL